MDNNLSKFSNISNNLLLNEALIHFKSFNDEALEYENSYKYLNNVTYSAEVNQTIIYNSNTCNNLANESENFISISDISETETPISIGLLKRPEAICSPICESNENSWNQTSNSITPNSTSSMDIYVTPADFSNWDVTSLISSESESKIKDEIAEIKSLSKSLEIIDKETVSLNKELLRKEKEIKQITKQIKKIKALKVYVIAKRKALQNDMLKLEHSEFELKNKVSKVWKEITIDRNKFKKATFKRDFVQSEIDKKICLLK